MYLCHGCYQGAEAASAMKKRPGREALALSIYSYIIFIRYHFSPVPFLYDYIAEPARTNLSFSSAFYLTVPCTSHVRPMYVSYTPHVHPQKNSGKKHTLFLPGV